MHAVHAVSRRTRSADPAHIARRPSTVLGLVALFIIIILVAAPRAQQSSFVAAPPAVVPEATAIDLLVGRSAVLNVDRSIERVSLTTPDVADAMVTAPQQLLIHGKTPGTITLFVWDHAGGIRSYEVNVRRDLNELGLQLRQLFPGEPISVASNGRDVVLSGIVTSKYVVEKAVEVAAGYVENKDNVVNLLRQQEGVASSQVMLRVRFAEVNRSALQELGASFVADAFKNDWYGRTSTQQFAAPEWDEEGRLVFSDFLNLFVFNSKEGLGGVVRALQNKGLFQSLAEPNLIATNGKEASFLAGGEYPYPVVQPSSGGNAVTIVFKEFGIRLNFTPTVLGDDLVHLKVTPEVSALDFTNAVQLEGFRIPALSTRRTETEVELRDGQTFAIAGLLNNTITSTMSKIPGIGDIPILGLLFRSKAHQKQQTELVVMITPQILRRDSTGVSEGLPSLTEPFLGAPDKALPPPPPYTGSPRYPVGGDASAAAAGQMPPPAVAMPASPPVAVVAPPPAPDAASSPPSAMPDAGTATFVAPAGGGSSDTAPQVADESAVEGTPTVPPLSKKEIERLERAEKEAAKRAAEEAKKQREREEKAAKAEAKRRAEEEKRAKKEAEKQRKAEEKAAREQAKREAQEAKRQAEAEKKRREEEEKRAKALAEAEARLRAAQAAYQAELKRTGKVGGEGGDEQQGEKKPGGGKSGDEEKKGVGGSGATPAAA